MNESPPSDTNFNLYVTLPGKPMTVSPSINANLNKHTLRTLQEKTKNESPPRDVNLN